MSLHFKTLTVPLIKKNVKYTSNGALCIHHFYLVKGEQGKVIK